MKRIAIFLQFLIVTSLILGCKPNAKEQQSDDKQNTIKDTLTNSIDTLTSLSDTLTTQKNPFQIEFKADENLDIIARFISGLPIDDTSSLKILEKTDFYQKHRQKFDNQFAAKEINQLKELRKWAKKSFPEDYESTQNVFYPFSGADFLTIHNLFPNATNYILFGLEPEGLIPDFSKISEEEHDSSLANLSKTIVNLMSVSFFVTKDMAPDLVRSQYKGILPVMLVFIARTGHDILDIQHVRINKKSEIEVIQPITIEKQTPWDFDITGVCVTFQKKGSKEPQSVTYFSLNVSDYGIKKMPQFKEFLTQNGRYKTYIKAASYLMHTKDFGLIKDIIQELSDLIVQDDSGIPYRYFFENQWDITLYGKYKAPIPMFRHRLQKDYVEAYAKNADKIENLNFGIGYMFTKGKSNLLVARKKTQ